MAAGRGVRAGGDTPKQYQLLQGKAVLQHTLEALLAIEAIHGVRVVIGADDGEFVCPGGSCSDKRQIVAAGYRRGGTTDLCPFGFGESG